MPGLLLTTIPSRWEPGWRTDEVGLLFYEQEAELLTLPALPPFFSRTDWLDGTGRELDFAYPLLTYDRYGDEYRWQLCQLLSLSGGHSQSDPSRDRFQYFHSIFNNARPSPTRIIPHYSRLPGGCKTASSARKFPSSSGRSM